MENIYIFALVSYLVIINPFIKLCITSTGIFFVLRMREYIIDTQEYKERKIIKIITLIKF